MESFSSPKRRAWVMRESFLSKYSEYSQEKSVLSIQKKSPQLHKVFIASTNLRRNLCSSR